jgi:hypothetical protein
MDPTKLQDLDVAGFVATHGKYVRFLDMVRHWKLFCRLDADQRQACTCRTVMT